MVRFYILPIVRVDVHRGPKYFKWRFGAGIDCLWSLKDMGSVDMGVLATDILQADHDALVLNADVYDFPENLDLSMSQSARSGMNSYLEAHGIPGDWLKPGDTFRVALRIVLGMFFYLQKTLAILGYPVDPFAGLTLNTQYQNIPNPLHDAMAQSAQLFGYTWNVGNNDQIRKIWKMMADQWGSQTILFGFTEL